MRINFRHGDTRQLFKSGRLENWEANFIEAGMPSLWGCVAVTLCCGMGGRSKESPDMAVAKSGDFLFKWRLPTLPRGVRSTIGAGGLNFSVRDGKRWNPAAIAA